MPISREEFEGEGIDWRQRILLILNADRTLAYTEDELTERLNPAPAKEQLLEVLDLLVTEGLVQRKIVRDATYFIHSVHGRYD